MKPTKEEKKPDACAIPPEGWECTRGKGHEGPCAAVPDTVPNLLTTMAELFPNFQKHMSREELEIAERHPDVFEKGDWDGIVKLTNRGRMIFRWSLDFAAKAIESERKAHPERR